MKAIGVDISLTATGVGVITGRPLWAATYVHRTRPDDGTLTDRCNRIGGIVGAIVPLCHGADLVAVEGPSYHSIGGKSHDRAGLWWALVGALTASGLPVAEVPPTVRMLWATGKGRADKATVTAAVRCTFRGVAIADDNAADALALAAMVGQRLGLLTIGGPHHVTAGRSVRWPR